MTKNRPLDVVYEWLLRRNLSEALVAEIEFPKVWRKHRDALTLQSRTMEGSDVKQWDDDLARPGW